MPPDTLNIITTVPTGLTLWPGAPVIPITPDDLGCDQTRHSLAQPYLQRRRTLLAYAKDQPGLEMLWQPRHPWRSVRTARRAVQCHFPANQRFLVKSQSRLRTPRQTSESPGSGGSHDSGGQPVETSRNGIFPDFVVSRATEALDQDRSILMRELKRVHSLREIVLVGPSFQEDGQT